MLHRLLLLACSIFVLSASSFITQNPKDMVREAERICAVEVLSASDLSEDPPLSRAQLRPIECYKGETTLGEVGVVWSGTRDRYVPGAPNLRAKQMLILFLAYDAPLKNYRVTNWNQGIIELRYDARLKTYVLHPKTSSLEPQLQTTTRQTTLGAYGRYIRKIVEEQAKHK